MEIVCPWKESPRRWDMGGFSGGWVDRRDWLHSTEHLSMRLQV